MCQELGLEYLYRRRWARRLCLLYKVFSTGQPSSIYYLLLSMRSFRRQVNSFIRVSWKSEYFKNSFIPNLIDQWHKLDRDIRSSTSYNFFKFIRSIQRKTFNINYSVGIKLLTRDKRHIKSSLPLRYWSRNHNTLFSALPFL